MPTVQTRHLTKRYDGDTVVRDVDLDIADGEFFVVVGPSGCGKSSFLRMVAGLESITSGDVLFDGNRVNDVPTNDRDLAMMFQTPTLYPQMTVAENLGFPLRVAGDGRREVEVRVAAMAAMLGITPLLGRRPGRLSGGQQQRVAMGRSLIRRPTLLLMDEPMSNLDAKLRAELRAAIGHLQQRLGVTTLYVTHDQVEAMSLGHRIAVMRDGEIVQCGTPPELYHRPVDAFVATFIGSPSMNLFAATVTGPDEELAVDVGASRLPLGEPWSYRLRDRRGTDVVVGIRPHDLRFAEDGLIVDVVGLDRSGSRRDVQATLNARRVSVEADGVSIRSRPARLEIDVDVDHDTELELELELWRPSRVSADPEAIHLFDPSTGWSLHGSTTRATATQPESTRSTT